MSSSYVAISSVAVLAGLASNNKVFLLLPNEIKRLLKYGFKFMWSISCWYDVRVKVRGRLYRCSAFIGYRALYHSRACCSLFHRTIYLSDCLSVCPLIPLLVLERSFCNSFNLTNLVQTKATCTDLRVLIEDHFPFSTSWAFIVFAFISNSAVSSLGKGYDPRVTMEYLDLVLSASKIRYYCHPNRALLS